jgi:diacylglycerol kinase family enzyme
MRKESRRRAFQAAMDEVPLPKRAILIVNAASRAGAENFEAARDQLIAAGVELVDAKAVEDPETLEAEVKSAVSRAPMVIVGGGDGTLSSAIDHFLGTGTVFGLLPLGTANSFARALGVPLGLPEAIQVIGQGRRKRIDLGEIDGDYFANTASIGLSPMIAQSVPPRLKKYLGRFAYLVWGTRCAFQFQPFRLHIHEGEQIHRLWSTEVRIANGGHFGGVELVETAKLDSGEIVIEAVTGKSLMRLALSWFAAVIRLNWGRLNTVEFRGREFRVRTWPRLWVSIDGEITRRTPVEVRVARGAVQVAAPLEVPVDCAPATTSASPCYAREERI